MSSDQNKVTVQRFIEDVLNQKNLAAVNDLVDGEALDHFKQTLNMFLLFSAFPDFKLNIVSMTAEADKVACLCDWTGTHTRTFRHIKPSGKKVRAQSIDIFRLSAGKIVEIWHNWDDLSLLEQIGFAPSQGQLPDAMQEPVLEVKEIQGNCLAGFNKSYQTLLFLEIIDAGLAKEWLRLVRPLIAMLEEVLSFNNLFKRFRSRRGKAEGQIKVTWTNIAFSYAGLVKLNKEADQFTDVAFKSGMQNRSHLLSDPTDPNSEGNCNNWLIGGPRNAPDIVLIVASDDLDDLDRQVKEIKSVINIGLRLMFEQAGENLPKPLTGHEHFGFRDGVSQPGVRGRLSEALDDFLTPRENPDNPNHGKPGQDLVWPGEFVFGYPGQDPNDELKPGSIIHGGPAWSKNGSYLVFRRYRQDVGAFNRFLQSASAELAASYPSLADLSPEKMGAKLMGRWASGAPIMRAQNADIPEIARDNCADNNFNFVQGSSLIQAGTGQCADNVFPRSPGDELGLICPHAAHIRKAHPRDDLAQLGISANANMHRIIRRGIPFGKPYPEDGERGLLFFCYQTSIERQFEHIIRNWLNDPNFRNLDSGYDPISGQNNSDINRARTFTLPVRNADQSISNVTLKLEEEWVTVTGGAYFFAPSISALGYLANDE